MQLDKLYINHPNASCFIENKFPLLLQLLCKIMDKSSKDACNHVINYLKVREYNFHIH